MYILEIKNSFLKITKSNLVQTSMLEQVLSALSVRIVTKTVSQKLSLILRRPLSPQILSLIINL